jgi:butyrate kinase
MVFPGENEMGALASGAYAALAGEEAIQTYVG